MSASISIDEYRALTKPRKYRNVPVEVDGQRFDSKLEANRYRELKLLQSQGVVAWFICQVPFRLPGGIRYYADFLIVWNDMQLGRGAFSRARVSVEDCKGMMTQVSANKIKQVEASYGITVDLVRAKK